MPAVMLGRRYKKRDPQLVSVEWIVALLTENQSARGSGMKLD